MFRHDHTGKFIGVFVANNFKADTAANPYPDHDETIPAGHYAPAPAVGKYRPDNNGDQTGDGAGKVITNTE
jgi:hypothetical protein